MDIGAVNVLVRVKLVRGWIGWTLDVPLARFRPAGFPENPAGRLHVGCAGWGWPARSAPLHGGLSGRQEGRRYGFLNPAAATLGERCRQQLNTAFLFLARRRLSTLVAEVAGQPWRGWLCRRLFLRLCFSEVLPASFRQQEFVDAHPGRGMERVVSHAQQGVHQVLVPDVVFLV